MSKITKKEKAVADCLRREIGGSRPAFSEGLHARLCRAVQQRQADSSPAIKMVNANPQRKRGLLARASGWYAELPCRGSSSPSPRRRSTANWFFRWASFAAAVCLMVAIGITWQARHAVRDAGPDAPALATPRKAGLGNLAELAGHAAAKTDAMLDTAVKAKRWAYLDQDARAVLEMPAARLPFDVVSSLLSVQRKDRTRGPSPRTTTPFGNDAVREQAGVRHG